MNFTVAFKVFFCLGVVETAASYRGDVTVDVTAVVTARHSMSQHVIETPSPSTLLARWQYIVMELVSGIELSFV